MCLSFLIAKLNCVLYMYYKYAEMHKTALSTIYKLLV